MRYALCIKPMTLLQTQPGDKIPVMWFDEAECGCGEDECGDYLEEGWYSFIGDPDNDPERDWPMFRDGEKAFSRFRGYFVMLPEIVNVPKEAI